MMNVGFSLVNSWLAEDQLGQHLAPMTTTRSGVRILKPLHGHGTMLLLSKDLHPVMKPFACMQSLC